MFCEIDGQHGQASVLDNLGAIRRGQGCYPQAVVCHQQALAIFREIGDKGGETRALNSLGEALLATGQPQRGRVQHAAALSLGGQADDDYQQARAHEGLARACAACGDAMLACRHWQQTISLYAKLGVPEARELRAQLDPFAAAPPDR